MAEPRLALVAPSFSLLSETFIADHARRLAFLPQTTPPADGMLVRELVALGRYPWHGALGRFGPADHAAVARALDECGVAGFADRLVDTLSGGERQRVWLAMMVAQQAGTLLLDEPISALDLHYQLRVMKLLRAQAREKQLIVIMVLHDLSIAARWSDRIVVMRNGTIVTDGEPREAISASMLADVYGVVAEVGSGSTGLNLEIHDIIEAGPTGGGSNPDG